MFHVYIVSCFRKIRAPSLEKGLDNMNWNVFNIVATQWNTLNYLSNNSTGIYYQEGPGVYTFQLKRRVSKHYKYISLDFFKNSTLQVFTQKGASCFIKKIEPYELVKFSFRMAKNCHTFTAVRRNQAH